MKTKTVNRRVFFKCMLGNASELRSYEEEERLSRTAADSLTDRRSYPQSQTCPAQKN